MSGKVLDLALLPAELAFRAIVAARRGAYARGLLPAVRVSIPVVSIGNLAVGGAGKTPVTRWLVGELCTRGARPAVLHGGYAADEPELHRIWHPTVPVIAGRDRVIGARKALDEGATVVVLDDAFQHPRLVRDLDLVLVAAETWTARPRLLPRGPWREAPAALRRARVVAVTRKTASEEVARRVADEVRRFAPSAPIVRFHLHPAGWRRIGGTAGTEAPLGDSVAVTGIAHPDSFVANAREAGAEVAEVLTFPDHHEYVEDDVAKIREIAGCRPIVTTAKDAVKLEPLARDLVIWVLEQGVRVEEGATDLARLLDGIVGRQIPEPAR